MGRLFAVNTLALILVASFVAVSFAGVKKIEPEEFLVSRADTEYVKNPNCLSSTLTSSLFFHYTVNLPKGRTVKELTYYHYGFTDAMHPPYTQVVLYRQQMGEHPEMMAHGSSTDPTDTTDSIIPVEDYDGIINFAKVKSGYNYWVEVYSANYNSRIHGVKITYK